jgi:putative oxidoreductase
MNTAPFRPPQSLLPVTLSAGLAIVFVSAAWGKIMGTESSRAMFAALDMEPYGRVLIGLIEAAVAFLLLHRRYAATGALLGLAVMMGAAIAHATRLGFAYNGDGGALTGMMIGSGALCIWLMYLDRKQLPIVGKLIQLDDGRTTL